MYGSLFSAGAAAHSHAQSNAAAQAGNRAAREATKTRTELESVQFDVEKVLMITEALWTILKEQLGYEDEELMKRIQEIDMRDGKLDGKVKATPNSSCPECQRVLIGKLPKCLYCGTEVKRDPFER